MLNSDAIDLANTGEAEVLSSGATWYEIETPNFTGWVNTAFLEPSPSTTFAALPCASGSTNLPATAPTGSATGTEVIGVDHQVSSACERTVILLDGDNFAAGTTANTGRFAAVRTRLPGIDYARVSENLAGDAFIARDRALQELFAEVFVPEGTTVVRFLENPARVVIDQTPNPGGVASYDFGTGPAVFHPLYEGYGANGSFQISGFARPFETYMTARILDANGTPVSVTWTGGSLSNNVTEIDHITTTSDWSSSWGEFDLSFSGLTPGNYTFQIQMDGADLPVLANRTFSIVP